MVTLSRPSVLAQRGVCIRERISEGLSCLGHIHPSLTHPLTCPPPAIALLGLWVQDVARNRHKSSGGAIHGWWCPYNSAVLQFRYFYIAHLIQIFGYNDVVLLADLKCIRFMKNRRYLSQKEPDFLDAL